MKYFTPQWPAPETVKSVITTRASARDSSGEMGFNLAGHVGDKPENLAQNRAELQHICTELSQQAPPQLHWLTQVHSAEVRHCDEACGTTPKADGLFSDKKSQVCAVLTADCLPILICNRQGTEVAAAHAGWRGLAEGVISNAVAKFSSPATDLLVYLGPAISQAAFEVGSDVKQAFLNRAARFGGEGIVDQAFAKHHQFADKYFADLLGLAKAELFQLGIVDIYGGSYCTVKDNNRFFSYRTQPNTGRFASLIWIDA